MLSFWRMVAMVEESIPQWLKPLKVVGRGRAKAEALAYLEAWITERPGAAQGRVKAWAVELPHSCRGLRCMASG